MGNSLTCTSRIRNAIIPDLLPSVTQATPEFARKVQPQRFLGWKKADLWAKYIFTERLCGTN